MQVTFGEVSTILKLIGQLVNAQHMIADRMYQIEVKQKEIYDELGQLLIRLEIAQQGVKNATTDLR